MTAFPGPICGAPNGPLVLSVLAGSGHPAFRKCKPLLPNQYAGTCSRCGWRVEARAGAIERGSDGRWSVFH